MDVRSTLGNSDYLNGKNGIVWATFQLDQAETLRDALLAQDIACEVLQKVQANRQMYLLRVPESRKVESAMDFVWRDDAGMRLLPDWRYPDGVENESFLKWIQDE
jgi:hypothetical protein